MMINEATRETLHRVSNLPCDIQVIIWQEYKKQYMFHELLHQSELLQYHVKVNEMFDFAMNVIDEYVKHARSIYESREAYFDICLDTVEDRIIDDDWFQLDMSKHYLKVLYITKALIQHPHLLKIELETEFLFKAKHENQIYILCSNIIMLKKLLR